MAIRVRCPNADCGKKYSVDEDQLGRTAVCRYCGREFTLSGPEQETREPHAETIPGESPAQEPSPETPEAGLLKRLGRFEIRARIGSGAFGTVYWAHDPVLDRDVALKVPRAAVLEKRQARARFLREPKAAAQLRHPHILPVYDAGTDGEHYYIASAYIEGSTLERVIEQERPDFRRAAQIVRDLAGALDYAHRTGVIHRDVKPANIMIDRQGQAVLMDFGLARLESSEDKLTHDGSLMGTPAYMAPEQADSSLGPVRPASDQYSLGIVLYELLCGKPPFEGPPTAVIYNLLNEEPRAPRRVNPQIARDLETICLKTISKRPEHRYRDCGALAEDLRRWLEDEPIHARRMGPMERLGRWCRRNPALASAVGIVVAVTLAALVAVTSAWRVAQTNRQLAEERLVESRNQEGRAKAASMQADEQRARAEKALKEAERAKRELQGALAKEEQARKVAEKLRRDAEQALAKMEEAQAGEKAAERRAEEATSATELQRRRADYNEYFSAFASARDRWLAEQYSQAMDSLDSCPVELRNWEWRFLKRRSRAYFWRRELEEAGGPCLFSPDGRRLAFCEGPLLNLWEVATAECVLTVGPPGREEEEQGRGRSNGEFERRRHSYSSRFSGAIAFGPDGARIAVARSGEGAVVLDAARGEKLLQLADAAGSHFEGISFSPDGQRIACVTKTESYAPKVILEHWDARTGEKLRSIRPQPPRLPGRTYDWVWDSASHQAILACGLWSNWALDEASRQLFAARMPANRSRAPTPHIPFSPDGRLALDGRNVYRHDLTNRRLAMTVDPRVPDSGTRALSPDAQQIAHYEAIRRQNYRQPRRYSLTVWDCSAAKATCTLEGHEAGVSSVAISPDGETIVSGSSDKTVRIWDALSRRQLHVCKGHTGQVTSVAISADGARVASSGTNGTVKVWDAADGRELATFANEGPGPLSEVAFHPDGTHVVVARRGGEVQLHCWDMAAQEESTAAAAKLPASGVSRTISFSADGRWFASRSYSRSRSGVQDAPILWDMEATPSNIEAADGAVQLGRGEAHETEMTRVVFSADGALLASADRDGLVKIWRTEPFELSRTLQGHTDEVLGIAFNPDGSRLASGGEDTTVRVWDTQSGREIIRLEEHSQGVNDVAFSSDGNRLLSAGSDGTVKIWDGTLVDLPAQEASDDAEEAVPPVEDEEEERREEDDPSPGPSGAKPSRPAHPAVPPAAVPAAPPTKPTRGSAPAAPKPTEGNESARAAVEEMSSRVARAVDPRRSRSSSPR